MLGSLGRVGASELWMEPCRKERKEKEKEKIRVCNAEQCRAEQSR